MSDVIWWLDAAKNTTSGGLLRYARSDGDLQFYAGNNSYYWIGFKCVKEANAIESALGNDKYEAYSYHSFIKFDFPSTVTGPVGSAVLYLRLYNNPEGDPSARCNVDPLPTNAYLDVWYKNINDGGFPWSTLSVSDYGWPSWKYFASSSKNVWEIVGQSAVGGGWLAEIDVTTAFNYAFNMGWSSVAFRFTMGKFGIPWLAPDDWTYKTRPTSYDQECWFILCGASYLKIGDPPPTYKETTEKSNSSGCPWLKVTVPSGELPEQWEPGEENNPTIINKIDADVEASMALAGTEGGGLWVTMSGGEWYKVYERYRPITAVYMDYIKNFVAHPNDQVSWFGTASGEIFKSTDSLYTWERRANLVGVVHDIEGSDLDSNKVAAAVGNSIYTTTNGGDTWVLSKIHSTESCNLMVRGDEIQAIFEGGKGFRSSNFGSSWHSLTGIPSSSNDVGFDNSNEQRSFVGTSGHLYTYNSGDGSFSYSEGAEISGFTNQIDVSHRSSIGLVGTTEKVYKTINFGYEVHELKEIPAKSVAIGGLVPVIWVPKPSDKPNDIFAKITDVYTGYYDMSPNYNPRAVYIVRASNKNLYALVETWKLMYSTNEGLTWEDCYQSRPQDLPDPFTCKNSRGVTVKCSTRFGGDSVLIDNTGNIHLIWGVWWLKPFWQTQYILSYSGGKYLLYHTILDKNHNFVSETVLDEEFVEAYGLSTSVELCGSAIDSYSNCAVLYKSRDIRIPHRLIYQSATCPDHGLIHGWTSNPGNDPANPKVVYREAMYTIATTGNKCPRQGCTKTMSIKNYWPAYPDGTVYRSGDNLDFKYKDISKRIWKHKYGPAYGGDIIYPRTRVTNNVFTAGNSSLVIDGNDTVHLTYTDPHFNLTYYINLLDGEADFSDMFYIGAGGFQYAIVDPYNNIHYIIGNNYKVRFSDNEWSDSELAPYTLTGSFSRSWNGTIWQLYSVTARRRLPLSAPVIDVDSSSNSFIIVSPTFSITNHSFEGTTALPGWGSLKVGSASRSGVRAYHGAYSLRLIGTTSTSGAASRGQVNYWAMPERTLVASAWVWCASPNRARIGLGEYVPPQPLVFGRVISTGYLIYDETHSWSNITKIAAGSSNAIGLKSAGTVVICGYNTEHFDVSSWTSITQVDIKSFHAVGRKSDGTVKASGIPLWGQTNVESWTGITQVAAGRYYTVGLKSNGTVIGVGDNEEGPEGKISSPGPLDVGSWIGITEMVSGGYHTVGLKMVSGNVVAVGWNAHGQCNVGSWSNITQVAASATHTVGLRSNGTVVAVGENNYGQCNVTQWTSIVQVAAGPGHTVGLKADGTVVAVGLNDDGQCDVSDWKGISKIAAGGTVLYDRYVGQTYGIFSLETIESGWDYEYSSYHPGDSQWHQLVVSKLIRRFSNTVSISCHIDAGSNVEAFFDLVEARCINPFYELSEGDKIQVYESSENDGLYEVVSYSYNSENEEVTIRVRENIKSDTLLDGRIIPMSSSVRICGMWSVYRAMSTGSYDYTKTTQAHTYYPIDGYGVHSNLFADGFAGTVRHNRAVYFWSDPPEDVKLLGDGNDK